ncbi:hypothetical protein CR513_10979, partial [Mucuna pruriens]
MAILGPRQTGNEIYLYLSSLVEDLRMLWDEGIDAFDRCVPSYFAPSMTFHHEKTCPRYIVKGHKTCLICEEGTCNHQPTHGRKTCYLGHKKFLKTNHLYRLLKKDFD